MQVKPLTKRGKVTIIRLTFGVWECFCMSCFLVKTHFSKRTKNNIKMITLKCRKLRIELEE